MAAETEPGFIIEGATHEIPALDSLSFDECEVLYNYTGLRVEQILLADDDDEEVEAGLAKPGFIRALMEIAYHRSNPKMSLVRVKETVGSANVIGQMVHLVEQFHQQEGDADNPPALTTEPEQSSEKSSVESTTSSGNGSSPSSALQVVQPEATGTIESDTSSTSAQASSAA